MGRGMKKWAAYRSLPEHTPAIQNTIENKYKVERPIISEEEAEIINDILVHYHGQILDIEYYRNRELYYYTGKIKTIEIDTKTLVMDDRSRIKLSEVTHLKEHPINQ